VGAAEHQHVISALQERNAAKARTAMERDLILGGEDFLRFLRTHEEFAVS
jgi:DNA-binding GntR family transcriptional regulator